MLVVLLTAIKKGLIKAVLIEYNCPNYIVGYDLEAPDNNKHSTRELRKGIHQKNPRRLHMLP